MDKEQLLWHNVTSGIDTIKLLLQRSDTQKVMAKDFKDAIASGQLRKTFDTMASQASHIVRSLDDLEQLNAMPRQKRWNESVEQSGQSNNGEHRVGQDVDIRFSGFEKSVKGKVDTGATTSSLNATNIKVQGNRVSFRSPELSNGVLTLDTVGQQDVSSADGGTEPRVLVKLDVTINGVNLRDAVFNLNDRSHMDSMVLIGQNLIKQGNFVVDINNEPNDNPNMATMPEDVEMQIMQTIRLMEKNNLTFADFITYLKTEAINRID